MTREEHLRAIRVVSPQQRGKRWGLLMLCAGPDCAGAEVYAPGLSVEQVVTAADAHIDTTEDDELVPGAAA